MKNKKELKTVCYFGTYDSSVPRNRVIIKGLQQNDVTVLECQSTKSGFGKYIELIKKHRRIRGTYDAMVVGFPGYTSVILARLLTTKPVIFDAFVSQYDSLVNDRKQLSSYAPKSLLYRYLDWLSVHLAHRVLLDTEAHIQYFMKTFGSTRGHYIKVLVGSDDDAVHTTSKVKDKTFTVHFHGNYIPLHGVSHIIEAARILQNEKIQFNIIGDGQEYAQIYKEAKGLTNVHFLPRVPYADLKEYMSRAHVALGIFGDTKKAHRVIPNKVYEALAVGVPVITGDSPAVREYFRDGKEVICTPMANSSALAAAILSLQNDAALRTHIGEKGHEWFVQHATPKIIGRELKYAIIDAL